MRFEGPVCRSGLLRARVPQWASKGLCAVVLCRCALLPQEPFVAAGTLCCRRNPFVASAAATLLRAP